MVERPPAEPLHFARQDDAPIGVVAARANTPLTVPAPERVDTDAEATCSLPSGVRLPRHRLGKHYITSGREEVDGAGRTEGKAPDGERDEGSRLEVAHEEADGEVRGQPRAQRRDERLTPDPVPLRTEQLRQFEDGRGTDDRGRQQERKTRGVLVRETHDEPSAHGRARAGEPGDEGDRLGGTDDEGLRERHLPSDSLVIVLVRLRRSPAESLRAEEKDPVEHQEERRGLWRCEQSAKGMLEEEAENSRRDRADDEEPAELRIPVLGVDTAVAQAAPEPAQDPHPVAPEEAEQNDRGRQMSRDEEGDEVIVVLVDVPAEQAREDDAVPEARDGEQLADALEEPKDDCLEVADRLGGDHVPEGCSALPFLPVWNQAKIRRATPSRNEAITCFT